MATGLASLGIERGDRIAVWLPSCPAWLELYLAATRLGVVVLAINTRYREAEIQDLLTRGKPKALVLWPGFSDVDFGAILRSVDLDALPDLEYLLELTSSSEGGDRSRANPDHRNHPGATVMDLSRLLEFGPMTEHPGEPDDHSIVFSSSGTTSRPKLVVHTQRSVTAHALAVAPAYGYDREDSVLMQPVPLCGMFGFTGTMATLCAGRPVVLLDTFDPVTADAAVASRQATHIMAGDDLLRKMLAVAEPGQLKSLRSGFYGAFSGDPRELIALGEDQGIRFHSGYGSSEVGALFTYVTDHEAVDICATTAGYPVHAEAVIRTRDPESGRLLPAGQQGELEIHSPALMVGLIDDPIRERERFTDDGFVRTGDLGYVDADGRMFYLGRAGDEMRLSGFLVSPREVEAVMETDPSVHRAVVVQVATARGPRPFAFVIPEEDAELDRERMLSACRQRLAKYKIPIEVVSVETFPLVPSPNGNKIDRKTLTGLAQQQIDDERSKP
jgi:fatty-acyl-CoA synthase